ncbi:MAG: glycosyltransferase [Planctomycetia bacterium]|nr:glycosyltransferase [Planctomycetia bacterium]
MIREEPLVSICCITYNHEPYIRDAIEGFLMQEAGFPFEIIIHDDASTDKTAEIIREYEQKHPDIIKPIYQTENQYSKGVKPNPAYNFPRARGKYIALCEGDDYWTDPKKLQKQVDVMEANPECTMSSHASKLKYEGRNISEGLLRPKWKSSVFTTDEIILGGGGFFATNSMVFKKNIIKNLPRFYLEAPVGDTPLVLLCATEGSVFYIDECMSVYRKNVPGSWNERVLHDRDKSKEHLIKMLQMYEQFDVYTIQKYSPSIRHQISKRIRYHLTYYSDCHGFSRVQLNNMLDKLTIKDKMSVLIKMYLPIIDISLKKLKNWFFSQL